MQKLTERSFGKNYACCRRQMSMLHGDEKAGAGPAFDFNLQQSRGLAVVMIPVMVMISVVIVVVMITMAALALFFQFAASVLGLMAVLAVLALGFVQLLFGIVDALFASLIVVVHGLCWRYPTDQHECHQQREYPTLP
jgi:hypothetical protein